MANKPFKVSQVKLYWASTAQPNQMSDKYQVDLCDLPKRVVDKLAEMGIEAKNKGDERGYFVTAKSRYPITTVDANGELIHGNSIANESVGDAVLVTYPFTVGKGTGLGINKLKVTKLIEFDDAGGVDMDDVEEL